MVGSWAAGWIFDISGSYRIAFLIAVGALTAVGFASVYIARKSTVSTASATSSWLS